MPTEPLILRDAAPPGVIVVVRLGSRTLLNEQLAQRCEVSFDRWGIYGFSVLEVPDRSNWGLLARLRPEVTTCPGNLPRTARQPRLRRPPLRFTMEVMSTAYDLTYDPNEVGGDMVVECWISHGPRAGDAGFDPQPGQWVMAGDEEEPPRRARVVSRSGNRVWIQLELPSSVNQVA